MKKRQFLQKNNKNKKISLKSIKRKFQIKGQSCLLFSEERRQRE
jgi:hypothetical protein